MINLDVKPDSYLAKRATKVTRSWRIIHATIQIVHFTDIVTYDAFYDP